MHTVLNFFLFNTTLLQFLYSFVCISQFKTQQGLIKNHHTVFLQHQSKHSQFYFNQLLLLPINLILKLYLSTQYFKAFNFYYFNLTLI